MNVDVVVAGGGAAGISAALILGRARRSVLLIDAGSPRNRVAREMHGFISRDGFPPHELLAAGRKELEQYPSVRQISGAVAEAVAADGGFDVLMDSGERHRALRLLLAPGVVDCLPDIAGLHEQWGKTAFVCPYCDGWEVRDRKLAIFGSPGGLVSLAQELYQWSHDLTICGIGESHASVEERAWIKETGVTVRSRPVRAVVTAGGALSHVELDDGRRVGCEAIFLCVDLRLRPGLVERLGCRMSKEGTIEVDAEHRTSVPGCYAAGDAMTKTHQVIVASASGVKAAIAINGDLTRADVKLVLAHRNG